MMKKGNEETLKDVVEVRPLEGCRLFLRFEDGVQGEVDISSLVKFKGVFAPLKDREFFAQVRVDPEIGTVIWPNGADLDPAVLYALVAGKPLPHLELKTSS